MYKNDIEKTTKVIKNIKNKCTKITHNKINLMAIDVDNLYPVSIVEFDADKNRITGIQIDIKNKMFIESEKLVKLFNEHNLT